MIRRVIALAAVTFLVSAGQSSSQEVVHDARGFQCGFIYDKTKGGKSGEASCSYTGDKVFSTLDRPFPPREHCETKEVFRFEDIRLRVDFTSDEVVWEPENGLVPFAVSRMIEYYMRKEKIGREEAALKVKQRPEPLLKERKYRIFYVYKGDTFVSHDPITQGLPKQPRNMPVYTVVFGWNASNNLYSLFVPGDGTNGEAILSHFVADGSSSWVNLRFGKCRIIK